MTMTIPWRKHATACTAALFLVVGVSGILIFFHLGNNLFKTLHEWLGLGFVALSILHVWRNGPGFLKLLTKPATYVALVIALGIAGGFVFNAATTKETGGNPMRRVIQAMETAPISAVAPVVGTDLAGLQTRLDAIGVKADDGSASLRKLAQQSGKPVADLFKASLGN